MSESENLSVACCSKTDDPSTTKDESGLKKTGLNKLIGTTSRRLNFLQVFEEISNEPKRSLISVTSEISTLPCHRPYANISFKSLPPLGVRDSMENLLRIKRYGEFPRRNLLKTFVKANNLERRPRRRLCQNKCETVATRIEGSDLLNSQHCPELNVKKLRYQLAKERKVSSRSSIGRFGQKIRNRIKGDSLKGQLDNVLYQGLSYEEVTSQSRDDAIQLQFLTDNSQAQEMLHALEKLDLNGEKSEGENVREKSFGTWREIKDDKTLVDLTFGTNDSATWCKNVCDVSRRCNNKIRVKSQKLNESESRIEDAEGTNFVNLESCNSRVDFSCGDDTRNLSSKLMSDGVESIPEIITGEEGPNQDYESRRRSVQWNSEVDVIYYAGDTDGGQVIRRKMEPLREEADQQARRNGYVKLALNDNLLSAFNGYKFREPWVTVFHK